MENAVANEEFGMEWCSLLCDAWVSTLFPQCYLHLLSSVSSNFCICHICTSLCKGRLRLSIRNFFTEWVVKLVQSVQGTGGVTIPGSIYDVWIRLNGRLNELKGLSQPKQLWSFSPPQYITSQHKLCVCPQWCVRGTLTPLLRLPGVCLLAPRVPHLVSSAALGRRAAEARPGTPQLS